MDRFKIEQMRRFYEIFPYPHRPVFFTPSVAKHLQAHGAFSTMLSQGDFLLASKVFHSQINFNKYKFRGNEILKKFEITFPTTKRILLVGCGTDEPLLFRTLHPKNELVCIDLSKNNIKIAKRKLFLYSFLQTLKYFQKTRKTEFILGDANVILKQNYADKFDYIQCFGVLHHQPDPEILLSGIADRLVDGGVLRMMVYSYFGRSLERKIQKKYAYLWENSSKIKRFKMLLFYNFFILRIWQCLNFFGLKKSTALRFKYLGLNSKIVADALMHPSDPGFCLEYILPMANRYNLKLIYCQAKIEDKGLICGFENPEEVWEKIMFADRNRNLLSNPILIFCKNS